MSRIGCWRSETLHCHPLYFHQSGIGVPHWTELSKRKRFLKSTFLSMSHRALGKWRVLKLSLHSFWNTSTTLQALSNKNHWRISRLDCINLDPPQQLASPQKTCIMSSRKSEVQPEAQISLAVTLSKTGGLEYQAFTNNETKFDPLEAQHAAIWQIFPSLGFSANGATVAHSYMRFLPWWWVAERWRGADGVL